MAEHKNEREPTPRQEKLAAGLVNAINTNKTKKEIALDAGYSYLSSRTVKSNLEDKPGVRTALKRLLTDDIIKKAQDVIRDGLDADRPVFLGPKAGVVKWNDFTERRRHAKLILDLAGLTEEGNAQRGSKGSTINIAILPAKVQEIIGE